MPKTFLPKGMLVPANILHIYDRPETLPPAGPNGIQQGVLTGLSGNEFGSPKGQISTTYSKGFKINGHEVVLPTVIDGKFHTDSEAIDRYNRTGEHLGIFDSSDNADAYSLDLHNKQEAIGNVMKLLNKKR